MPRLLEKICNKKDKNNQVPHEDGVVAKLVKCGREALVRIMQDIIHEIGKHERTPEYWNYIPMRKMGDKTKCDDYGGITLVNSAYKVLTNIINTRIKVITGTQFGEYQCGFREVRRILYSHIY